MGILKCENIHRSFSKEAHILKGVDLSIEQGTFNVMMGPSGSGKTTLLNILGVLDTPSDGRLEFMGDDIIKISSRKKDRLRRKHIGYIFQSVALINNMTAFQNVDFALRICGYPRKERRERVTECLTFVGLEERMHHYPSQMSGGEQQRVAIARAIAHKPKILLADEPTAELDTTTGLKVVKVFRELVEQEGLTILMCTHDEGLLEVADQQIRMRDGVLTL